MYNPLNNICVNASMRWPWLALPIACAAGLFIGNTIGLIAAWFASVALATWAATKLLKKQICDCEGEAKRNGWGSLPKVNWVIEHNPETGSERPWDLFSMFGDDESTKQHYASYATEENALKKKDILEKAMNPSKDD